MRPPCAALCALRGFCLRITIHMAKIFFSGIGGSGLSALACFMADRGYHIAGSDRSFDRSPDNALCALFRARGISIVPQDGSGIDASYDLLVLSTAVEDRNPDIVKAREANVRMLTRPQYLSEIAAGFRTIAVAGTSGKSTTAGLLAFLLRALGMEPNFIGGGRVKQFRSAVNPGNSLSGSSDLLVIEACESDGSVVHYYPLHSIITNLSLDHNAIETTGQMFETLGRNTAQVLVIGGDDRNLSGLRFDHPVRFSVDTQSEYTAESVEYRPLSTSFSVRGVSFQLALPGRHNLCNALAAIALLTEMGIGLRDIAGVLPDFAGVERRFDIHLDNGRHLVIDDYAHNPHKIASLMQTITAMRDRVCYIFQPHGFGPTLLMKQGYIEAFVRNLRPGDHLMLLPIYFAGGTAHRNISSELLSDEIRSAGRSAEVLQERSLLFDRLGGWDSYIVFGARDDTLAGFAQDIARRLQ